MMLKAPLLIILPGLDGTVALYEPFCQFIEEEQEAVVIGYPKDSPLTIDELVEYAEARIPQNQPVILMGVSFSGPIAVRLLVRGRREYIGTVFCTTFVRPPRPFLLKLGQLFPIGSLLSLFSFSSFVRYLFYQKDSSAELIEQFQKANNSVHSSVITSRVRALSKVDEREVLKRLSLPCCYLKASEDRVVLSHSVEEFRKVLGSLQIVTINGPHALLQCKPEESWAHIRDFIKENC